MIKKMYFKDQHGRPLPKGSELGGEPGLLLAGLCELSLYPPGPLRASLFPSLDLGSLGPWMLEPSLTPPLTFLTPL